MTAIKSLDQVKDMTTERERFEAWCRTTNSMPCEHKWIGWQAALSAPPDTENRRAQPATLTSEQRARLISSGPNAGRVRKDAQPAAHAEKCTYKCEAWPECGCAPSVAPEPVAWQMIDKHGDTVYVPVTHAIKPDLVLDCDLRHPDNAPHEQRPLFAHPPRAPLTEEQKRDLVKECDLDWQRGFMPLFDGDPTNRYAVLIEAVEAAHGIGGK